VAHLISVTVAGKIEGTRNRAAVDCLDRNGKIAVGSVRLSAGRGIKLLDHGKEIG
jgi:hypothetical protein